MEPGRLTFVRICLQRLERLDDGEFRTLLGWSKTFLREKVDAWDRLKEIEATGLDMTPAVESLIDFFEGIEIDVPTLAEAIERANLT